MNSRMNIEYVLEHVVVGMDENRAADVCVKKLYNSNIVHLAECRVSFVMYGGGHNYMQHFSLFMSSTRVVMHERYTCSIAYM